MTVGGPRGGHPRLQMPCLSKVSRHRPAPAARGTAVGAPRGPGTGTGPAGQRGAAPAALLAAPEAPGSAPRGDTSRVVTGAPCLAPGPGSAAAPAGLAPQKRGSPVTW